MTAIALLYIASDLHGLPSKSYLMPPRWRELGNGSTPVSHHITTRLQRVDENVDQAKLRGCARLSLTWGLGSPVGVGWVGPGLEVGSAGLPVRALGKYLDPVKMGSVWPSESGTWGTKISGDRPGGLSAQGVTSDLATCGPVQDVLAQGILDKIYHNNNN